LWPGRPHAGEARVRLRRCGILESGPAVGGDVATRIDIGRSRLEAAETLTLPAANLSLIELRVE